MRKYINRKSIIVLILSAFTFIYMVNNFNSVLVRYVDDSLIEWLLLNTQYPMVIIFDIITMMASWQAIILLSLALLLTVRDKMLALITSSITGVVFLINETIKNTIERPRPNVMHLTKATGYSMPSGHSITAMVFYGLIILLFVSQIKDKRYRRLAQVLLSILIVLVGFSRVYLRVHYLSDVVAGFALGLVILSIIYNLKVGIFDNITTYIEGEEIE